MNTLKTIGVAVFVAAVTALSVVWYIDYKVNQVTEAVLAPVHSTTEKVTETVSIATEVVEGVVDGAETEVSDGFDKARADLIYEWENAKDLAGDASDWLVKLRS